MSILYGDRYPEYNTVKDRFRQNLGIYLNNRGIYDKIKENGTLNGLEESLGIYYQEETPSQSGGIDTPEEESSVPDNNRTIKRVITYSIPQY